MHALGAAEPVGAQLRVGCFQRVRHGKQHIVNFNFRPRVLTPEHDDKQHCRDFLATWQRLTILRLNPFVRPMPHC